MNNSDEIMLNEAFQEAMTLIFRRPKKQQKIYPRYYQFSLSAETKRKDSKYWHEFYIEEKTFLKQIYPYFTKHFPKTNTTNHTNSDLFFLSIENTTLSSILRQIEIDKPLFKNQIDWEFYNTFLSFCSRICKDFEGENFKINICLISKEKIF